jgi:ferredoxin
MDTAFVRQAARKFGADLVGVASIDRFKSLPPEQQPAQIFPECRSVIVLGRRILRGALRGIEEGTNFGSTYATFGFRWLEDNFLSKTTYDVTCAIEAHGFEAVPLFGYNIEGMPSGQKVAPDKPAPNVIVDLEFAAQAAGLGEVGLGDFFLSPGYGPRQRFALILTDAELEPDPVSGKTVCDDCGACAAACPFGAIRPGETRETGVPGHRLAVAAVDYAICRACPNGAMTGPGRGTRPDRCAAACVRACVAHLETKGRLTQTFLHPFRKREPWALDVYSRPVESGTPRERGDTESAGKAKA